MRIIFEVTDKNNKLIRLTNKQHSHIMEEHSYMHEYLEQIKETLQSPDKIRTYSFNRNVKYFYKGYKNLEKPNQFLLVIVKYLNGEGYIISSYLTAKIQ